MEVEAQAQRLERISARHLVRRRRGRALGPWHIVQAPPASSNIQHPTSNTHFERSFLTQTASYDVASYICQAPPRAQPPVPQGRHVDTYVRSACYGKINSYFQPNFKLASVTFQVD